MERNKSTSSILRQFRKKSKRIVNKDLFTEFFYFNRDRKAIEFLLDNDKLLIDSFFNEFLPVDFREFASVHIMNDSEEPIKTWFYDSEDLVVVIKVNWGFRREEISMDIDIENFMVTSIDETGFVVRAIDFNLFNDFVISFLTNQAKILAESYNRILNRKEFRKEKIKEDKKEDRKDKKKEIR